MARRPTGEPTAAGTRLRGAEGAPSTAAAGTRSGARGPTPRGRHLALAGLALIALWTLALVGLSPVFGEGAWIPRALAIGAAAVTVGCGIRIRRPARRWIAVVTGGAAGLLCWGWGLAASDRVEGWLRYPAATAELLWQQIDAGTAPLDPDGPLEDALLLAVLLLVALTLCLLVGFGRPLAAGVVPALCLLAPAAITGLPLAWPALLGAGVLLAILAWLGSPEPAGIGLLAAGAAIAVAAGAVAVAPPTRDRVWNSAVLLAPISSTVPDVTIALADDLRQRSTTRAFRFAGDGEGSFRFALATLSKFEGGRWTPQDELADPALSVTSPRSPRAAPPGGRWAPGEGFTPAMDITVTIEGLLSSWLPLPQGTARVADGDGEGGFDAEDWRWTAASATARSERASTRSGDRYRTESAPLIADGWIRDFLRNDVVLERWSADVDADAIRYSDGGTGTVFLPPEIYDPFTQAPFADPSEAPRAIAPYLELPEELPGELSRAARRVAGSERSRLGIGFALQDWFRGGDFAYDESAPYRPGTDPGDPYAVMTALLSERSGFCVHYASTFAVMARELGVPARIAVGYAASARRGEETSVRGTDLHAWPEIYLDDMGWVAFEPTPGGAGLRADTMQDEPAVPGDGPGPDRTTSTPPPPSKSPGRPDRDPDPSATDSPSATAKGEAGAAASPADVLVWAVPALALGLLLTPAAWRGLRRRRRMRALHRGDQPAQHAWEEFVDTAADLALLGADPSVHGVPRARTAEALVEHLEARGSLPTGAAAAAKRLAGAMAAERYGPDGAAASASGDSDPAELLREALGGLAAGASRGLRIRAALAPRSILRRGRAHGRRATGPA